MEVRDYLERIGADFNPAPTLETLNRLHEQHLYSVPFENLDIHRSVAIVLDQESILEKIVRRRRGGFCYELNSSFAWLLRCLGYDVTILSAEVMGADGEFGIAFDHMTLRVDIEGNPWLADVGFGESFLKPLALVPDQRSADGYHLTRRGETWYLAKEAEPKYRFTLKPYELQDFEPGCRYHQTSPESPFTRKTVTTRATPSGRVTLTSSRCIVHEDGVRRETPVSDEDEWRRALESQFGIVLEPSR